MPFSSPRLSPRISSGREFVYDYSTFIRLCNGVDHEVKRVHFGDIISFYKDEVLNEKNTLRAYLTAEGFIKSNCWLKPGNPDDFTDCLFRISVKESTSSERNLFAKLDRIFEDGGKKRRRGEIEIDEILERVKFIPDDERQAVLTLVQEVQNEKIQNEYEAERSRGVPVEYGQIIQFKHVKTGKYLARRAHEIAESDSGSNKVNLDPHGSQECWFTLEPRFKVRDGIMKYGDPVVISCCGKHEGQHLQYCQTEVNDASWDGLGVVAHEITAATASHGQVSWKLGLFMAWEEESETFVKAGDIITLFHCETESLLSYDGGPGDGPSGRVALRGSPSGRGSAPSAGCGTEIGEKPRGSGDSMAAAPDTFAALWRLERQEAMVGGTLRIGTLCRLRHIPTGRYLALYPGGHDSSGGEVVMSEGITPRTLLRVVRNGDTPDARLDPPRSDAAGVRWEQQIYLQSAGAYLRAVEAGLGLRGEPRRADLRAMPSFGPQDAFQFRPAPEPATAELGGLSAAVAGLRAYLRMLRLREAAHRGAVARTRFDDRFAAKVLKGLLRALRPDLDTGPPRQTPTRQGRSAGGGERPGGLDPPNLEPDGDGGVRVRQDLFGALQAVDLCVAVAAAAHRRVRASEDNDHHASDGVGGGGHGGGGLSGALSVTPAALNRRSSLTVGAAVVVAVAAAALRAGGETAADRRAADAEPAGKIFCLAHEVLRAAVTRHERNALALLPHLDLLQEQVAARLAAPTEPRGAATSSVPARELPAWTLLVALEGGAGLREAAPASLVEFLLVGLGGAVEHRWLHVALLAALAGGGGHGVRRQQDVVVQRLLRDRKRAHLLFATRAPELGSVKVCARQEVFQGALLGD